MNCPYCNEELVHEDYFGRVASHQDGKILGEIFKCPNGSEQNELCPSENLNVAGAFYLYYSNNELHEGYPC
jgi:hypothetical protein